MTTPTLWVAVGALWLGCLLPGPWPVVAGGAAALAAARLRSDGWRLLVIAIALVCAGSGTAGARITLLERGPLADLASRGGSAPVRATVVTDARATQYGVWQLVRVSSVGAIPTGRRALIRPHTALPFGSTVTFEATARPLGDAAFDVYLRRLHVGALVDPTSPVVVERAPPASVTATNTVRWRVRKMAADALPRDAAALLSGLVIGDTTGLSQQATEQLRGAGLSHLVAVSGSNVAIVLGGVAAITAAAGIGTRGRRRIAVLALLWFCVLVRAEPSVLRASAMALLVIGAGALGRGHDARHTLGVATLALLLIDPMLAGQLGFALSVLATGGVLVAAPAIADRLPGPRPLAVLVGATAGAQMAVAPVLLFSEDGLSFGALPANLIAVPAAAVASTVGVAAVLVAQVWLSAGSVIATLARPALTVVLAAGRMFDGAWTITPATFLTPVAAAVLLAFIIRRRYPLGALAAVGTVVVVSLAGPWGGPPPVTGLTLTALDVGQGDAVLIEVPRAPGAAPARMLVDGGPDQQAALRLLRERGIGYLDAVVATHPHADHTDGLPAVLSRIDAGAVLVGPVPPLELDGPSPSALAVEAVAAQRRVPLTRVAAGERFALGRAVVEVLSPPADGSAGIEPNDNSVVLRVSDGADAILLTGDAEEAAQLRMLQRPDLLVADVLKVPHHGGATNAPGFIDAVGADTAVIGVGADNDYGHPHPDVLADLAGTTILRTDTDGTVSVAVE